MVRFDHVTTSSGGADRFLYSRIIDAVSRWCDALHGDIPLQDALGELASGLGAVSAMIIRTYAHEGRGARVAVYDPANRLEAMPLSGTPTADKVFGVDFLRARAGSIWHESDLGEIEDACAFPSTGARRFTEFSALVLAAGGNRRDHIEFYFLSPVNVAARTPLLAVSSTIVRTWAERQVGLATRTILNHRSSAVSQAVVLERPVLSSSNPARLSRAEFRVCLLLSRGLSVQAVCDELDLAEATIRSHLRSIYAKTEIGSLPELLFLLLKPHQAPDLQQARRA